MSGPGDHNETSGFVYVIYKAFGPPLNVLQGPRLSSCPEEAKGPFALNLYNREHL